MPHINYKKYKNDILQRIDFLQEQEQNLITKNLCDQKAKEINRFFDTVTPNYTKKVIFVGPVGAGKTTAICHMLGLTFEKEKDITKTNTETGKKQVVGKKKETITVLSTASGRTTICEVKIHLTTKTSIEVLPFDNEKVESFIYDFADFYCTKTKIEDGRKVSDDEKEPFMHSEYEQALCYMVGYTYSNKDQIMDMIRANSYDTTRVYNHFLQNFDIVQRQQTLFEIDDSKDWENQKEQVNDIFKRINYGRHKNSSLPQQIIVNINKSNLNLPKNFGLETIIDTKGLDNDDVFVRQDIIDYIYDKESVCVFVSTFNQCPLPYILKFGDNVEFFNKWNFFKSKFACLITAREQEWSKVSIGGDEVEDQSEAYYNKFGIIKSNFEKQVKTNYWKNLLKTKPKNLYDSQIKFYDAVNDNPSELVTFVNNLHIGYEKDIIEVLDSYKYFDVENLLKGLFTNPVFIEFSNDCLSMLDNLFDKNNIVNLLSNDIAISPSNCFHYATQVRAVVNRYGYYNYYDFFAMVKTLYVKFINKTYQDKMECVRGYQNVLQNQHSELYPSFKIIEDSIKQSLENFIETSTQIMESYIKDTYQDSEVWLKCRQRWGQGQGFRSDIISYLKEEINPQDTTKIYKKLSNLWFKTWENEIKKLFTDIQKSAK